jgi:flagellar hook-basal body complex protein FliE
MASPLASWKNDSNYNALSQTLTSDYTTTSALDADYLKKADALSTYQQKSTISSDLVTAGFAKTVDVTSSIASATSGLQNATQVENLISDALGALPAYEVASDLDADVAGLGFLKSSDVSGMGFQSASDVSTAISSATASLANASDVASMRSALYDFFYAFSAVADFNKSDGQPYDFSYVLGALSA